MTVYPQTWRQLCRDTIQGWRNRKQPLATRGKPMAICKTCKGSGRGQDGSKGGCTDCGGAGQKPGM